MSQPKKSQTAGTVSNRIAESRTVLDEAPSVSAPEVDAFLKLLANITKRVITEEAQPTTERQAS